MKYTFLTLPLTALCLLSCSSSGHDDPIVPEPDDNRIGISFGGSSGTWQEAPTTRAAAENGLQSLYTSFRTWGYKTTDDAFNASQLVMDGYHMKYLGASSGSSTTNSTGWEYVGIKNSDLNAEQSIKYWDFAASSYRFFAYAPFDADVTLSSPEITGTTSAFSFPFAYDENATATSFPYVSKMWLSTNNAAGELYGQQVRLTFAPMIAKVRFRFTYPEGTETIQIKDIQFCDSRFKGDLSAADTPLSGTLTVSYPLTGNPTDTSPVTSWLTATGEGSTGPIVLTTPYEEQDAAIHIISDPKLYGKWYYVPPLADIPYTQGAYTITALIDGNLSTATVPAEFMQWKAGYQYTYIFKITEAGAVITFADMQVEQWLPGTEIDNKGSGTEGW